MLIESVMYMALTIFLEARGEPDIGQRAVGYTIMTRAEKAGKTIKEIVTQPKQYSCYNGKSPDEYFKIISTEELYPFMSMSLKLIEERPLYIHKFTFEGESNFFTVTHYHTRGVYPGWSNREGMKLVATVGNHKFYHEKNWSYVGR